MNINMQANEQEQVQKEISEYDWNQLFQKGTIKKEDMDLLVIKFLLNKDLAFVAGMFQEESGCHRIVLDLILAAEDLSHLETQTVVAHLLSDRRFDDAIDLLNEKLGLDFLKNRRKLHFRLLKQKLVEFFHIRDFNGAYEFGPEFLKWADDVVFRKEALETVFSLCDQSHSASSRAKRVEFLRSVYLGNVVVQEMKNVHQGPKEGDILEKAMKMVRYVEDELNKVVKFPNFSFGSGFPEFVPGQQNDV